MFAVLDRHDHEIFRRIQLRVLAAAGQFARERLDAFFSDRTAVEPAFRGREVAAVVRGQFANASPEARRSFERALEAGPLRYGADLDSEPNAEAKAQELAGWQRQRLLWFRDRMPETLQDMAQRLGVRAERHSPEDEGLAEDGFYSSGGFAGETSPISLDQLRELDADAFVEYVVTWRPDPTTWKSPTRESLNRMLAEYAAQYPADSLARAQRLVSRLGSADARVAGHVQGLLDGIRTAVEAGSAIDWSADFRFLVELWPQVEAQLDREERRPGWEPWRWLATAIVDFVIAACRKNAIPRDEVEHAWTVMALVIKSGHTWESTASEPLKSFGDVLTAALNNAGGRATEGVLELACAEFRANLAMPEREANPQQVKAATVAVSPHLRPLLEHALAQSGRAAIAARATIGTYIPAIHLLDRDWLLDAASRLFESGTTDPLESPAWAAYLTRASLFNDVFNDLRGWYVQATTDMPALVGDSGEREHWSVTQHLADHVFGAFMRGLIDLADDDRLIATVFEHLPAQERAHISWQAFRGGTDAKRPVSEALVERLLRFWRWRLEQLAAMPASGARQEELSGLTWLICTPYLPDREVLDLGFRTLELATGDAATRGAIWERLTTLVAVDVDGTFRMAELAIRAALDRPHPYITLEQTENVLQRALADGNPETRDAAMRLIHTLGERGHVESGRLLPQRCDQATSTDGY